MGIVFNIQRFSVHDGPGIRTTVFLKGCTLNCAWCHNPESIDPKPQLQYFKEKDTGCKTCEKVCPKGIKLQDEIPALNSNCDACGICAEDCPNDARKIAGKEMTAEEVMEEVLKDKQYYENSGGGITLSGGEPLHQPDFAAELFRLAKEQGLHTTLDTAGNVPWSAFEKVLPYLDLVLLDLKIMDNELHRKYTGHSNTRIHENAKKLFETGIPINIRIPVIGGVNDTVENARATAEFIRGYDNIIEVKLLPYHSLGLDKAKSIGMEQQEFPSPNNDLIAELAKEFDCYVKF